MNPQTQPSVVITGASSGIGRDMALYLTECGYRVFAGVRKQEDADSLAAEAGAGLTPLFVDVTDDESIVSAAAQVQSTLGDQGLDALVNNAGISVSGPLELIPVAQLERQLRVNVTGQVAVTQAFLPALRKARGRIVFVGSESGLVTMPLLGAYSASKHAIEAVANALRVELYRFGIRVSLIEPGGVKTPIWSKAIDTGSRDLVQDPALLDLYKHELRLLTTVPKMAEKAAVHARVISRVARHAMESRFPRARYLVGREAFALKWFMRLTPTWVSDYFMRLTIRVLSRRRSAR